MFLWCAYDLHAAGTDYLKDVIMDRNLRTDWMANGRGIPVPTQTFQHGKMISIGHVKLRTDILDGHDIADGAFWIASDPTIGLDKSILMTVDVLFPGWCPSVGMSI